jgi:methanogenic corrinoid protein MtbC1
MLEGAGFTVIDLGVNTPPDKIVAAIKQHEPPVVGFSAFLTTTMPMFKVNIDTLTKAGLRDKVKVMVGGAPVTAEYARKIGADGYAPDANATVRLTRQLMAEMGYDTSSSGEASEASKAAVAAMEQLMDVIGKAEAGATPTSN